MKLVVEPLTSKNTVEAFRLIQECQEVDPFKDNRNLNVSDIDYDFSFVLRDLENGNIIGVLSGYLTTNETYKNVVSRIETTLKKDISGSFILGGVYILPEYRNRRLSTKLLFYIERYLREELGSILSGIYTLVNIEHSAIVTNLMSLNYSVVGVENLNSRQFVMYKKV